MNKKLTYFTPTYNRANLLEKLYNSLLNQTNKDFVWLIIDDGSSDNTKDVVSNWVKDNKIEIQYHYKQNGGKHTAMDMSNQICTTKYICCVDSDDYLSDNATEVILNYIDTFANNDEIVGFVGRRANYSGEPFQTEWPQDATCLYFDELSKKYNYKSDTILVFKTDIIKQYHFPVIKDERFVTEIVYYNQFIRKYKFITMKECLYLAEYQPGGYTAQGMDLFFKNPKGYLYYLKQLIYINIEDNKKFKTKVGSAASYYAWKSVLKIKDNFKNDYKIKFPYNMLGCFLQIIVKPQLKRQYEDFVNRQRIKNDERKSN